MKVCLQSHINAFPSSQFDAIDSWLLFYVTYTLHPAENTVFFSTSFKNEQNKNNIIQHLEMIYHVGDFREQYETWKAECQKMVPVIGTGKFISSPIVFYDGQPIEDTANGNVRDGGVMSTSSQDSEKKVIQWKLLLHQIGMYMLY